MNGLVPTHDSITVNIHDTQLHKAERERGLGQNSTVYLNNFTECKGLLRMKNIVDLN